MNMINSSFARATWDGARQHAAKPWRCGREGSFCEGYCLDFMELSLAEG